MADEDSVELLEAMNGLGRKQVEPRSSHAFKGGEEHSALGDVGCVVKV